MATCTLVNSELQVYRIVLLKHYKLSFSKLFFFSFKINIPILIPTFKYFYSEFDTNQFFSLYILFFFIMDIEKFHTNKDDSSTESSFDPNDPLAPAFRRIPNSALPETENKPPKSSVRKDANNQENLNSNPIDPNYNATNPPPENFGTDLERYETSSSSVSKLIANPENINQLESLARVVSTRRMSVPGANNYPLKFDPEDFDLNALLNSISQRLDADGVIRKYTGVALTDVSSWGIDATTAYGASVSEVLRSIVALPSKIMEMKHKKVRPIIRKVNLLVREGELLLVLGRPSSGCSTLLKTIAGEVDQFTKVEGQISYSGASQDEMLRKFKADVIYVPECKLKFELFFFFFCYVFNAFQYPIAFRLNFFNISLCKTKAWYYGYGLA